MAKDKTTAAPAAPVVMRTLLDTVKAARRVSTPILTVGTADQPALMAALADAINGGAPKIVWDCMRGLRPVNDEGRKVIERRINADDLEATVQPQIALAAAAKFDPDTVLFMFNIQRFLDQAAVVQAICNLRDSYKQDRRTLILLTPGWVNLPAELQSDVIALDEPLPNDEELLSILTQLYTDAGLGAVPEELKERAVASGRGLSRFGAEQVYAMSLRQTGLDLQDAWERKRAAVSQTPGLSLTLTGPTFDDIGGVEAARTFGRRMFAGNEAPLVLVRLDEIEKMWAGAQGGDLSGVSTDQLGAWLRSMEDEGWDGMILVGPPGATKTMFSRALGITHQVPVVDVDLGAQKGSLVGESEQRVREGLRTIKGLGGKRVFIVATCNKLDALPPELRRRFRSGIWFFDLPTAEEREQIWKLYLTKYKLSATAGPRPDDADWTGAEIRNVCDLAYRLKCSLIDASAYIVPVIKADPASIHRLREQADGRFLSAAYAGPYRRGSAPAAVTVPAPAKGRAMTMEGQ